MLARRLATRNKALMIIKPCWTIKSSLIMMNQHTQCNFKSLQKMQPFEWTIKLSEIRQSMEGFIKSNLMDADWLERENDGTPSIMKVSSGFIRDCLLMEPKSLVEQDPNQIHHHLKNMSWDEVTTSIKYHNDDCMIGYPMHLGNLLEEVAFVWLLWMWKGSFPIHFQKFPTIEEDEDYYRRFDLEFTPRILSIKSLLDDSKPIEEHVFDTMKQMGLRGIQTCLRQRKTVGTTHYLIPSITEHSMKLRKRQVD